jgi:hypothetical protein
MNLIPNIPPKLFSGSAVVVGYLLIDDLTANEQNALGNWLMLVAQVLSTNAFYKQVMAERGLYFGSPRSNNMQNNSQSNKSSNSSKNGGNNNNCNINEEEVSIVMLEKMIRVLQKEVDDLKKEL